MRVSGDRFKTDRQRQIETDRDKNVEERDWGLLILLLFMLSIAVAVSLPLHFLIAVSRRAWPNECVDSCHRSTLR